MVEIAVCSERSFIVWQWSRVATSSRRRLLKQDPATIWLTGLSGSGKSSLAFELEQRLIEQGHACFVLDGDNLRHGLNSDLTFNARDRAENVRRNAEVARLLNEAGLIVLVALISPYANDRERARTIIGKDRFVEVYLKADISTCEKRDPKGLYEKARRGEIGEFTGVNAPYEVPQNPNLVLETGALTIDACVSAVLQVLSSNLK